LRAQPQRGGVVGWRCSRSLARGHAAGRRTCLCCRRRQHLTQQIQQAGPCPLRVASVVGEHEADNEAFVVVLRQVFIEPCPGPGRWRRGQTGSARDGVGCGCCRTLWLVHPAMWLVAQLLKLPGQAFADLARAALDLAPVAGLDLYPLSKAPFQASEGGCIGMTRSGPHEFLEEHERVIKAHLRNITGTQRHGAMIKPPCPTAQREMPLTLMTPMTTLDGNKLPCLGLGTYGLGAVHAQQAADIESVVLALQLGYGAIDTAEMYADGGAERVVGQALVRARTDGIRRESIFVVSKVYPHHAAGQALQTACESSLQRLGLQQLDLYLLHWRGRIPLADTVAGMQGLVRQGLIRHWGVSNFDVSDMLELLAIAGGKACAANQIYLSLSQRGASYDLLPWLVQHRMLAMAYSPVDKGALLEHEPLRALAAGLNLSASQLALAWAMQQHGVMAIPKAARATHLRENLAAAELSLSAATHAELDQLFPPPRHKLPLAMS
jgi:diketogulonate reductase-like aldo/keto reductase